MNTKKKAVVMCFYRRIIKISQATKKSKVENTKHANDKTKEPGAFKKYLSKAS